MNTFFFVDLQMPSRELMLKGKVKKRRRNLWWGEMRKGKKMNRNCDCFWFSFWFIAIEKEKQIYCTKKLHRQIFGLIIRLNKES